MKKRVLSLLLAVALCFSTQPMTVTAQGTDTAAAQEVQTGENTTEVDTTGDITVEDVSGGDTGSNITDETGKDTTSGATTAEDIGKQDSEKNAEKDAAVQAVQALIDALPENVTADNAETLSEQLAAIDAAMAELTEEQSTQLDLARYEAVCAALATFIAVQSEGHTHYLCGGSVCNDIGGHKDSETTFTKLWMNGNTLTIGDDTAVEVANVKKNFSSTIDCYVLPQGNYYLGSDITLDHPLYISQDSKTVNLCLNGKTITADGDFDAVILYRYVDAVTTFSLTDCEGTGKITHTDGKTGSGVYAYSHAAATFNMYGGTISGNKTSTNGGGVYMDSGWASVFHMYGGTITDNTTSGNGGGVYIYNEPYCDFHMYGGTIKNNSAANGGGVYADCGNIEITDGLIENNTATINGGGVNIGSLSTVDFTMSGGTIANNNAGTNGGGMYVGNASRVMMSGAVTITGNKVNSNSNNVYLITNKLITVASNLNGASIGVTTEKTPETGNFTKVAAGTTNYSLTDEDEKVFSPDAGSSYAIAQANGTMILKNAEDNTLHYHPVCGEECTHLKADGTPEHEPVYWEGIGVSTLSNNMPDGYYYLTENVELTKAWTVNYDVALDLNGHTITGANGAYVISVYTDATLTITDCKETSGKITHASGNGGTGIAVSGTLTLWNGNIVNNGTLNKNGGGVFVVTNGTFNMNGGMISGNKGNYGGGVLVGITSGKPESATFNMTGGTIAGNASIDGGGGVYMYSGTFNMTGGTIAGNCSTTKLGSGVYLRNGTTKMTISGNVKIADNWQNGALNTKTGRYEQGESGKANNAYLAGTGDELATITINEELSENSIIGISKSENYLPIEGNYVTVATSAADGINLDSISQCFSADAGKSYNIKELDGKLVLINGELHEHPICGKTCTHKKADGTYEHESVVWTGVSDLSQITTAGNYFLTQDIELTATWTPGYNAVLDLDGHTISVNSSNSSATIYINSFRTFTMTDCKSTGKITHTEGSIGNGVRVEGTFTMYGGTITGNKVPAGGGVSVENSGTFKMIGGKISDNDSTEGGVNQGGGVFVRSGHFYMEGGSITGNKAGKNGGGVYVSANGYMDVSGDAQIENNLVDGSANNVYLTSSKSITIGTAGLTGEARIGVTTAEAPTRDNPIKIATDANDDTLNYTDIFTSDVTGENYAVVKDDTALYLVAHQHSWVYTGEGAVITAKCSGCDAEGGKVTLTPPEKLVYDGNEKIAEITFSKNWQGRPVEVGSIDIFYTKDGKKLDGLPKDVGTYVASISVGGAIASVEYTIQKAPLTVTAISNKIWYGNEPMNAGARFEGFANSADTAAFTFTPKYTYDYPQYGDVGTYEIIPQCPEGVNLEEKLPNYEVIFVAGTLTVERKEVFLTWENYENRIYGDDSPISVTIGGLVNNDEISAVIEGADLTVGKHTASARLIGEKADNYKLLDPTCTYTVDKATQTLKFITTQDEMDYNHWEFDNLFTSDSSYHTTVMYESSDPSVVTVDESGHSRVVGAGTATITAWAVGDENYYASEKTTCKVIVDPRPVTISGVKVNNKTYDGTTAATFDLTNAKIDGIVIDYPAGVEGGVADDLQIDATNAKAVFADANAGTDKDVTITGFKLSGADAGNYILSEESVEVKADITRATITVTPKAGQAKTYGESDPKLDYTVSGAIGDETPSFTGALSRETGETVGNYAITEGDLKLTDNTDSNFRADNYVLNVSDNVNFTIKQATPEIKVGDKTLVKNGVAVDITNWASFNNNDEGATLTYTLVGTPVGITLEGNKLTAANADTTASSFTIQVTAEATANFTAPASQTITVTVVARADAGVKVEAPTNKTYRDADFTVTATTKATDNGIWSWTSSNESILKIVSGENTATPTIHVGNADAKGATLTATYISDAYYGTASVTITVAPKAITADMISEIPAQEYTGKALQPAPYVTDDEIALVSGKDFELSYSGDNTNVGTATVTITGIGNYTGEQEKSFKIAPKSIENANITLVLGWFEYNGKEKTVEIASVKLADGTVLTESDYKIKDNSNKATNAAMNLLLTIEGTGNYTGTASRYWMIFKTDPKLTDFDVVPDLSTEQTYSGEAQTVSVSPKTGIKGMGAYTVKYNGNDEAPTNVGSYVITISVSEGNNYNAIEIPAGTLTIKKAAAPKLADIKTDYKYATTGTQTVSVADLVADATGYTLGEIAENEMITEVTVSENGVVTYTLTGKGAADSTVTIPVTITSRNYDDATVNVVIEITKATPTGEPGYDFVHDSSKTLADAGLDLINSTLNPKEGTLEWIDSDGNVLPGDTKMEVGKKYIWRFTPADPNYETITGEVELYAPYRILEGANSTWTQNTDGTVAIRGNGEFAKFRSVKVDGVVIDPKNYTAVAGSTIITLKTDYLKTLSTGSHTFELVWTDGTASTEFTVTAKPDNGDNSNNSNSNNSNNNTDSNDSSDDDSNDTGAGNNVSSGNNTVPAAIGAPKTGDASGIWMTLFAVSLAGLAAMLVRKKSNRE